MAEMFGKLELRYTRGQCHLRFESHKSVSKYKVVAKDEFSVVIVTTDKAFGNEIWHIHFTDDGYYWIYLGSSGIREFFQRISKQSLRVSSSRGA